MWERSRDLAEMVNGAMHGDLCRRTRRDNDLDMEELGALCTGSSRDSAELNLAVFVTDVCSLQTTRDFLHSYTSYQLWC